jgi:hypothetical protein
VSDVVLDIFVGCPLTVMLTLAVRLGCFCWTGSTTRRVRTHSMRREFVDNSSNNHRRIVFGLYLPVESPQL